MTVVETAQRRRAASLDELEAKDRMVVGVEGNTVCLLLEGGEVHAVDNRCPHMGFPLHRGSVADGILTCHWHHARFDLCSGGTFDQWADELRRFPVEVEDGEIYVDVTPRRDPVEHQRKRLHVGLERDLALVVAKAAIVLAEADPSGADAFREGLDFGVARRGGGWFRGLTTLSCLMNLVPRLDADERAAALYHGLADVANDSAGMEPRFPLEPLPGGEVEPARLARWFRGFVEVRDAEGAERALVSAVRSGASQAELADMLFAAATDHRYLDGGHTLDFVNKALEALDVAGWERAEAVLASLPAQLAFAERMEEANAWRNPVDLVSLLEDAFERLPEALGRAARRLGRPRRAGRDAALATSPPGSSRRCSPRCARARPRSSSHRRWRSRPRRGSPASRRRTSSATGTRPCTRSRSPTRSSRGCGDRPRRSSLRGVLDAAMSVYLDRFLNVPATRLPEAGAGW